MVNEKKGLVPKLRFPEFIASDLWTKKPLGKLLTIGSGRDYTHLSDGNKIESLKEHKKGLLQQLFPAMDEMGA